ncbi:MAG: bifunctional YncE family protein/alkaline phosphatase family protein [Acidobacteria bacterium]|nr:bifunctional YncE family protein/alkaline phosphatase family protein [Acidobacteriota bacterium]
MRPVGLLLAALSLLAAEYRTPAGTRRASASPGNAVLPGGRLLTPLGEHHFTGPGPFGLALSPSGATLATSDGGPNRYSLTILRRSGDTWQASRMQARGGRPGSGDDWTSVFMGLAFEDDRRLWASEGNSGRVRLVDTEARRTLATVNLNTGGFADSYPGDLALDRARRLLYVADQANFRIAVLDTRKRRVIASQRAGRLPFAIALSPDARRVYVTNIGMFEYKPIPGADPSTARETGLTFPAFGFPSPEAVHGTRRETVAGNPIDVPGLGEPNVAQANSLAVVNVEDPAQPKLVTLIPTGRPFGRGAHGGSSPSGVLATGTHVYVSNAHNDTITVIHAGRLKIEGEIPIRIPGLEQYRGVMPLGMAYHDPSRSLFVAEAGINAIGVIDTAARRVSGHLPAAWFPTRVLIAGGRAYVSNAKGFGTGPNAGLERSFSAELRRGTVSIFPLPGPAGLPARTEQVYRNNGFLHAPGAAFVPALRHVVLIVKENRTFDEVFGDIARDRRPARFGRRVTPNHHEMARRWALSENFYADSEVSVDGHHWLVGSYPNAWTESSLMSSYGGQKDFRLPTSAPGRLLFAQSNSSLHPEEQLEAGAIWHHLERHRISFRNYGEGFELAGVDEGPGLKPTGARYLTNVPMPEPLWRNTSRTYPQYNMNIPDQYRATRLIAELETMRELPRFIYVHLPNDHIARPRPADGYPTEAAYVADNDYALGRILEYLTRRAEWKSMAVLITEDDAQGGVDHVDSHRTILLVASPYARRGCVSRVNSSFPGILKTVFRLLGIPPLNLYDATAAGLGDCFEGVPDFAHYDLQSIDKQVFDPARARDPLDPKPSPRMDDPRVLREQHRRR